MTGVNWHGIAAIYRFEIHRFGRTFWTSLMTPVITTSLYVIVFGAAIGSRMKPPAGLARVVDGSNNSTGVQRPANSCVDCEKSPRRSAAVGTVPCTCPRERSRRPS